MAATPSLLPTAAIEIISTFAASMPGWFKVEATAAAKLFCACVSKLSMVYPVSCTAALTE
jgi:hypothetical protein